MAPARSAAVATAARWAIVGGCSGRRMPRKRPSPSDGQYQGEIERPGHRGCPPADRVRDHPPVSCTVTIESRDPETGEVRPTSSS